jgi:serine/threonine protein kinase/tetratricopeptide (TPR) repeat protein
MIGTTISHYRVLEKLGAGGMGVVYKAQDIRLGRFVALKFLPEDFVDDPQVRDRFQREAQAASALNHPNICTLYDIGEADGRVFMAMEFLDGVTLKDLVLVAPLRLNRLLDIAIQVLDGLEAAHAQGIIHRDIKPANIFVPTHGRVKILDFGVAKITATSLAKIRTGWEETVAIEGSRPATTGGWALGTMPYMSPEQALGKPMDERSDLFSFGVTLYEMATGQMPFKGETTGVLFLAIVQETPIPPMLLNQSVPAELQRIVDKCLEKDRDLRYQHASEIRADLQQLIQNPQASGSRDTSVFNARVAESTPKKSVALPAGVASQPVSGSTGSLLSRPQPWKPLTLLGVLVAALVLSGVFYWRSHKKVALTDKDTVVLGDFANNTGEAVFDDTLKMALMVALNQSPFLDVLSENKVGATLKLMTLPTGTKLTPEVARDLCQRAGGKAYIAPSIASLGSEYVIGLKAVNCQDGAPLARELATAAGKEEVLGALGQATTKLRGELGESLASVQQFDVPLEEATTPSLEALTAYSQGLRTLSSQGENAAIGYFKRAVELDPNFALAYASLGTVYANLRESELAKQNYQKAYDLRSRVSAREQYAISAYYYNDVTGEVEKSNETYQLYAKAYPRSWVPRNNLGGNYAALGQWPNALAEVIAAVRLNPDSGIAMGALVEYYCRSGRYQDAKATYQQAVSRGLDYSDLHYYRYAVAFVEGDAAEMQRQADWATGKPRREDVLLSTQSDTEAFTGHLQEARDLSRRSTESAHNAGEDETAAKRQLNAAIREAEFGYPEQARSQVAAALRLSSSRSTRILAAIALARAGDADQAEKMADELEKQNPLNTKLNVYWLPTIRAAIELDRQNPAKALDILKEAAPYELGVPGPQPELGAMLYPVYLRGCALLALHQGGAAKAEFQKYLDHRGLTMNSVLAGLAPLGLARAEALQGAPETSAAYQNFLTLWKSADPDIPIYQQARAEYAKTK